MKNERLNGGSGCNSFVVADTLLKKYNGNDEILRLPGFVYGIGNRAFAGNANLKNVMLSSNVISVGENAFDGCKLLEEVNLPYELKSIGKLAFNGCVMLMSIIFNGTKERWFSVKKGEHWLEGTPDFIISCKDGDITKQEEIEVEAEPQVDFTVEEKKPCDDAREAQRRYFERRRSREIIARLESEMDFGCDEDDEDEDDEIDKTLAELEQIFTDDDADEEVDRQSITDKLLDKITKTKCVKDLATVLSRIAEKKQDEITADSIPSNSMWGDEEEFDAAVMDRLEKLVRSDLEMARCDAIKKAEICLEAVRDTRDGQMMQVYERIVYELKIASDSLYDKIRDSIRSE